MVACLSPRRGDDCSFAIILSNADGTRSDLSGVTEARFTYGDTLDGNPLVTKTIGDGLEIGSTAVAGAQVPAFLVSWLPTETLRLEAFRLYAFQFRVNFSEAQRDIPETVLIGFFTVGPTQ